MCRTGTHRKEEPQMKRALSVLLAFVLALTLLPLSLPKAEAAGSVAINETNFPDENFRDYVAEECDANGDGKLSASEIADVRVINVANKVHSLAGIEYFTALEELDCRNGGVYSLETLDLRKNTALKKLQCQQNVDLKSLDVSGCPALEYLDCNYTYKLTSLDLSKCTKLTYLDCYMSSVKSLDLSSCVALEYLKCSYTDLTSLDVRKCTALTHLDCSENEPLTALDVSRCTALEYLDCSSNSLTSLDVSKNTKLISLDCFGNQLTKLDLSNNTALTNLSCNYNQLTKLDVSKNTALTELWCRSNKLTTLDVSKHAALTKLFCEGNQITSLNVSGCTALTELYCSNNLLTKLNTSGCMALTDLVCKKNQLTSLNTSGCEALADLECTENQLSKLDVSKHTALRYLDCDDNQLTSLDVSKNTALKYLYCTGNQLTALTLGIKPLLISLACYDNAISRLDIGTCPRLIDAYNEGGRQTTSRSTGAKIMVYGGIDYTETGSYLAHDAGIEVNAVPADVPISTDPPVTVHGYLDGTVTLSAFFTGVGLTYQWKYSADGGKTWKNSTFTGCKTTTLTIPVTEGRNKYQYCCLATDANGKKYTDQVYELLVKSYIKYQPQSSTAMVGEEVLFQVIASGAGLTYQWQYRTSSTGAWKNSTFSGSDTGYLFVPATAARNGYQYRCVITDANGEALYSDAATLNVIVPALTITTQPKSVKQAVGTTAKFTVEASDSSCSYQWQWKSPTGSWTNCSLTGAKTATLSMPVTAARNGYQYRCKVSNSAGSVTSSAATLTVRTTITTQPQSTKLRVGETAKLTVKATGAGLTYQWQWRKPGGSWTTCSLTGAKTATLSVPVTAARNGYQYRCVINNANNSPAYSNAATLTVRTTITAQPKSVSAKAGSTVKFTVSATGAGLTYQWQYRTSATGTWATCGLTGNKTATLTVPVTAARSGYQYRCVINNANNAKAYSNAATLTVVK